MADIFIKFDGIEGESVDKDHKGEIEILSWSWGANQQGTSLGGGRTGKVQFQDFHFSKQLDKSSPKLMLSCASGKHIKTANLSLRRGGENPHEFLKIKMQDILISSYSQGSSGEERPGEEFTLLPEIVYMEYYVLQANGTTTLAKAFSYDLKKGTKL